MPEESIPIFKIQDFKEPSLQAPNFYFNTFETHLREHAFIQKPHKHDFYILILVTQGTGTHTIDFQQYKVQSQTVFFLSPGQVHSWQLSEETKGYILFFNLEFYLLGHPEKKLYNFPFFNSAINKPVLKLPKKETVWVTEIILQIGQEFSGNLWKKDDVIRDLLDILLLKLTRNYRSEYLIATVPANTSTELMQFESLVEKHFREHFPVKFYADQLHLTIKQLNDLCRHMVGKTTTELIQDRLILEARRLLIHSGQNISQIAAQLGYFDNSYFSRFFKKHTGQTPEQFRIQAQ